LPTRTAPSRPVGGPGRALAGLVAVVAGLAVAFVVAPPRLAGPIAGQGDADLADRDRLGAAFRTSLVEYWRSGDRRYPPALQRVVDYWFRFHLVKGGIAALLLIALVALGVVLWRARLRSDGLGTGSRAALVAAGTAVPLLALFALAVVVANVQGAMAPFASLFPMLMDGTPDAGVAGLLAQGRRQLAGSHRTGGYTPPALDAMVSEFAWYHLAVAVIALVVLVALLGLSVVFWRGFARTRTADRPTRRVLAWFGVLCAFSSVIVLVLVIANTGTAMDPAPALLGLFDGGF
jgi:heme/copper-type cytochrome/quinol oxidase subunit 2